MKVTSAGFSREAGFGRRILAYLIDYVIVVAAGLALTSAGVFVYALFQPDVSESELEAASLLVYYAGVAGSRSSTSRSWNAPTSRRRSASSP